MNWWTATSAWWNHLSASDIAAIVAALAAGFFLFAFALYWLEQPAVLVEPGAGRAARGDVPGDARSGPARGLRVTGRRFRLKDFDVNAYLKVNTGGELQLQDSLALGGAVRWRMNLQPVANAFQNSQKTYQCPPFFTAGVFLAFTVAQLASTATANVDGYEESQ